MASQRQNGDITAQQRREHVLSFARRKFNLATEEEYLGWCLRYNFSVTLDKSDQDLQSEYTKFKKLENLKKTYVKRGISPIEMIYEGLLPKNKIKKRKLFAIYEGFRNCEFPDQLRELLLHVNHVSKLVRDKNYVSNIVKLVDYRRHWIRPIHTWKVRDKAANKQFSSLVRHLFARYAVPEFMDMAWKRFDIKEINWFLHIARGENIRTAYMLPVKLSKRAAHYFMQAPAHYTVDRVICWAQARALGGDEVLAEAVADCNIRNYYAENDFWLSVIKFFVNHPQLPHNQYWPVIDYIADVKYQNIRRYTEDGELLETGPAQADYSMKGRSVNALLQQMQAWHERLALERNHDRRVWEGSKIGGFYYPENTKHNETIWTIQELLSSVELIQEGERLHHCVASYADYCFSGETSIWSVQKQAQKDVAENRLTIEVDNKSKEVVQLRGKYNRYPEKDEIAIVRRWIAQENLKLSKYMVIDME